MVVDSGDTFFKTYYPYEEDRPQMMLKAGFIVQGYNALGVDAWVPGELDFMAGRDYLLEELVSKATFPVVGANAFDHKGLEPLFPPFRVVERGGLRVVILGLCNHDYNVNQKGQHVRMKNPAEAAVKVLKEHGSGADVVVALTHLGFEGDVALAKEVAGIDVIVGGHSGEQLVKPHVEGSTLIVQAYRYGKYVGTLSLLVDSTVDRGTVATVEERSKAPGARLYWKNLIMPLRKDMKDDGAMTELFQEYRQKVTEMHSKVAKTREEPREQVWWYVRLCSHCHKAQYENWKPTAHARAMATLERENSHMDMECIGCHTIGFRKAGGFRHPADMENFENVQCEACHGPGSDHSEDFYGAVAAKERTCKRCHDEEHHPDFDFSVALPKVRCPKVERKE